MKRKGGKNLRVDPVDLIPSNDGWDKDRKWISGIIRTYEEKTKKNDSWIKLKEAETGELKANYERVWLELERKEVMEE